MIPEEFKIYYKSLGKQTQELIIEELLGYNQSSDHFEDPKSTPLKCPHCSSAQIVSHGKNLTR